jgi:hypothetical protein
MKVLTQTLVLTALPTVAMADYVGLSFEYIESGEDLWTMRLYAQFTESTDQLNAVFGDSESDLYIRSANGFYQHFLGGPTSISINTALIPLFPSLEYDSWVTIGSENQTDNAMLDIGIDWTDFENGGDIETDNGVWFATPNDMQVIAGDDFRVLIGQFTTFGFFSEVYGYVNLQGKQGDFETFVARDQYFGWIPTPGALAIFGLAGLNSYRRRR